MNVYKRTRELFKQGKSFNDIKWIIFFETNKIYKISTIETYCRKIDSDCKADNVYMEKCRKEYETKTKIDSNINQLEEMFALAKSRGIF